MNNEQEKIFRNHLPKYFTDEWQGYWPLAKEYDYHQLIRDKRKRKILKIYNYG